MSEKKDEPQRETQSMSVPPCPDEPKIPILSGLGRLVRSSKALVALGATGVVGYLAYAGKVPIKEALEVISWIVGILLGAVAVEDAAVKLGGRYRGTSAGRANWLMQVLSPMLGSAIESMKRPASPPPAGPAVGMYPAEPMAVVPIRTEHWNKLAAEAISEGKPPDAYVAMIVNELLDGALSADEEAPADAKKKEK
jgi:hypothetical protein